MKDARVVARLARVGSAGFLLIVAVVGRSAVAAPVAPTTADPPARWLVTGAIGEQRVGQGAALLSDGQVLLCGGRANNPGQTVKPLSSCELWSPADETWSPAGALREPRIEVAAVPLGHDRVAFIGGWQAAPAPTEAEADVDVWDRQHGAAAGAGRLPFPAEHPHAVRLPDGRVFVIDDGPEAKMPQAAIWDPTSGRSSLDEAPHDSGQTAALLVDHEGMLTLVRRRAGCSEVAIWRRSAGRPWALAHVEKVHACAAGAAAVTGGQIAFWIHQAAPAAFVWDPATGASRLMEVPTPEHHQQLVPLDGDRWLAVGWASSSLYEPGRGWRSTGGIGGGDEASFTRLPDGRVLMVAPSQASVWTPAAYSPARPCAHLTARLRSVTRDPHALIARPTLDTVEPGCVRAIAVDPSLEASRALRELAERPPGQGGRDGITTVCDLRPPWAIDLMIRGLDPKLAYDQGASCLAALGESDAPAARQAVDGAIQDFIRGDRWAYVLVQAARSSERLRARAGDVLVVYWTDKRDGFDQLKEIVCRAPVPRNAAEICGRAMAHQESEWKEQPKRRHAWMMTGAVTAIGAGLAVGGYLAQDSGAGRAIAVAAGGLGTGALLFPSLAGRHPGLLGGLEEEAQGCLSVTLGVLGAVGAGLATSTPGASRAAVSALGGALFTGLSLAAIWSF
jgi:hypothetical protein